jgi:hypothetical protein
MKKASAPLWETEQREIKIIEQYGVAIKVDAEPDDLTYADMMKFCRKKAIDRMTNRQRKQWAKAGYPEDLTGFLD